MQYWRVSGAGVDLADKDAYHPDWAAGKVEGHSAHFASLVVNLLRGYHDNHGEAGIIAANYDTELLGHWWFEGVSWLEGVLRRLAISQEGGINAGAASLHAQPPP